MAESAVSWRPSRRLSVRAMWALWLVCLVLTPAALLLQHATTLDGEGSAAIRAGTVVVFLWLVLAWLWPVRPAAQPGARPDGHAGLRRARWSPRWLSASRGRWRPGCRSPPSCRPRSRSRSTGRIGDDNLAPHRPSDIVALGLASLAGALVVLPLGPGPGLWLTSSAFDLFWWTALSTAYVFVGSACVMLLVQRRPRTEAIPTRLARRLRPAAGDRRLPRRGLRLRRPPADLDRAAPRHLGRPDDGPVDLGGLRPDRHARGRDRAGDPGGLPAATAATDLSTILLLDSLMTAFVFVVLLLSLVRDQRAYLAGEVVRPPAGGDRPGGPARHRLRVDQRGAGADGHRRRRTAAQRGGRRGPGPRPARPPSRPAGCAGWPRAPRSPTRSTATAPTTASGCWRCSSPACSTPGRTASWPSSATSRPSSAGSRSWPASPPSPRTT